MKIKLTILCCLLSFHFLSAQTEQGTISVGLELQSMNLSFNTSGLSRVSQFSIDGNVRGNYFIKDNWSVGLGIGTSHSPKWYSFEKLYDYNVFVNTTKFFNKGGNWQPFVETNFGYLYSYQKSTESNGSEVYKSRELTLDIGGGIQYNANQNLSLFIKANPEWKMDLDAIGTKHFYNQDINFHLGLFYNLQKNKK